MGVTISAVKNIPQIRFVPQDAHAERKIDEIEKTFPASLSELLQQRWLVLRFSSSPPSLDLSLTPVKLF